MQCVDVQDSDSDEVVLDPTRKSSQLIISMKYERLHCITLHCIYTLTADMAGRHSCNLVDNGRPIVSFYTDAQVSFMTLCIMENIYLCMIPPCLHPCFLQLCGHNLISLLHNVGVYQPVCTQCLCPRVLQSQLFNTDRERRSYRCHPTARDAQ